MARTLDDILSGASQADKFREHLGQTVLVTDFSEVSTRNGTAMQFTAVDGDGASCVIWAPSIVERQLHEFRDNDLLPARVTLDVRETDAGKSYFTFATPDDEQLAFD